MQVVYTEPSKKLERLRGSRVNERQIRVSFCPFDQTLVNAAYTGAILCSVIQTDHFAQICNFFS